jgi:hypothetical protein
MAEKLAAALLVLISTNLKSKLYDLAKTHALIRFTSIDGS